MRQMILLLLCIGFSMLLSMSNVHAQSSSDKIVNDIRSAYERLDFSVAETRIQAALENYQALLPAHLSQVYVIHAHILFARSDIQGATSQLQQALQLAPGLTLDPIDTPPELYQLYTDLKSDKAASEGGATAVPDIRYLLVHDLRPGAALRSMVIPGWGQMYKGEKKRGVWLTGTWVATAGGSLMAHLKRKQAKDFYLASTTTEQTQARFKDFSTWHKVRNNLLIAASAVWVYSYLDAILIGSPASSTIQRDTNVKFSLVPIPKSPYLSVAWQF